MTQTPEPESSMLDEESSMSEGGVPRWVNSVSELEALVESCLGQPFVAIDTEFERTSTYFANPGLIQIADTSQVYLVDPLAVSDLTALGRLLVSEQVVKVLHSMSEDVELLHHACGVVPVNVFDTQVAATFLNLGVSMGYQRLVLEVLDVELDKSETRSDWLQRPLSPSQIHYAVKDTEFLRELYSVLRDELAKKALLEACLDECSALVDQVMGAWAHPELAYLKLRGAWSLSPERQMLLQDLVIWRDRCAVEHNVPKSWVFSDALLIEAVDQKPSSPKELYRFKGVKGRSVKQFGARLIQQLDQFEIVVDGQHEFVRIDAPLRGRELELYKQLKKVVTKVAETSGLPAQLLASRKNLEQAVVTLFRQRSGELPAIFHGWRKAYLEAPLTEAYEAYLAG